jgi:hypothetical protein
MLATALLLLAQDRSTPEKSFEGFAAVWSRVADEARIAEELRKLGEPHRTEEFRRRLARRPAASPVGARPAVSRRSEGKDGSVAIDAHQEGRPLRVIFAKSGDAWLVREIYRGCPYCEGTGACRPCEGRGSIGQEVCFLCEGKKKCKQCSGEKLILEDWSKPSLGLAGGARGNAAPDFATPKGAAQSYADLLGREAQVRSDWVSRWFESRIKDLQPYLTDAQHAAVAKAFQKERAEAPPPGWKVDSLEEKEAEAIAVLTEGEARIRVKLKKAGDRWLADAEEVPCGTCGAVGSCDDCKSAGWVPRP